MSAVAAPSVRGLVLADLAGASRVRTAALVLGGALLTTLGAQISIHVPPSPVPVTGQTLGVLLAGTALGARRGAASQALYLVLGLFLPVYADGESGPDVIWGATGGYIVGFILAAYAIGWLAERGHDRRILTAFASFVVGQLIIFGIGVPWLMVAANYDLATGINHGFTPFIVGGIIKAIVGGLAMPYAWKVARVAQGS